MNAYLASIKAKITLLAVVGIVGMLTIAAVNKYLDMSKNQAIEIGRMSQGISGLALQSMLIEEQFINSNKQELLKEWEKIQKDLSSLIAETKSAASDINISHHVEKIVEVEKSHGQTFASVSEIIFKINELRLSLNEKANKVNSELGQVVKTIDVEEVDLILEGRQLDTNLKSVRDEVKKFINFLDKKVLNVQNLFIYSDNTAYEAAKKVNSDGIKLVFDNISTVLKFLKGQASEYTAKWENTSQVWPQIAQMDDSIYDLWNKNRILQSKLKETSKELQETALSIVDMTKESIQETNRKSDVISLFVGSICLVLSLIMSTIMIRAVIQPITNSINMMKDIAEGEGNLTRRLEIRSPLEMVELARWFNTFVEKIQLILKEVAQNAKYLNDSSSGLSSISEQLAITSQETSKRTNSVSGAGKDMSQNLNSVAQNTQEASKGFTVIASATEQLTVTISEIAQNAEKARGITFGAVEQANRASTKVQDLGDAAEKIAAVVDTVANISEQVNLLALNATIEAARAGESGKGFAVVANEIKELAQQTAKATDEIKNRVDLIQNSTQATVGEIESITKVVNDVNAIVSTIATAVEEQSSTTKEIAGYVAQAFEGFEVINKNINHSSNTSATIASEVEQVTHSANEISTSSSQVNMSAAQLSELAKKLDVMVGRFVL